jgi:hypothetical protein
MSIIKIMYSRIEVKKKEAVGESQDNSPRSIVKRSPLQVPPQEICGNFSGIFQEETRLSSGGDQCSGKKSPQR